MAKVTITFEDLPPEMRREGLQPIALSVHAEPAIANPEDVESLTMAQATAMLALVSVSKSAVKFEELKKA